MRERVLELLERACEKTITESYNPTMKMNLLMDNFSDVCDLQKELVASSYEVWKEIVGKKHKKELNFEWTFATVDVKKPVNLCTLVIDNLLKRIDNERISNIRNLIKRDILIKTFGEDYLNKFEISTILPLDRKGSNVIEFFYGEMFLSEISSTEIRVDPINRIIIVKPCSVKIDSYIEDAKYSMNKVISDSSKKKYKTQIKNFLERKEKSLPLETVIIESIKNSFYVVESGLKLSIETKHTNDYF